ncbi:hypothetical protein QO011_002167 [Labrys wisconsinensis]|uniref:Uncharacterized protein n=1 Tax=Labrys wisconsinensis TaxID=425677 RepID=A0ABU0J6H1_9HYPH|nr:hypothetical protein [Labrys wisconsinensis]
MQSDSRARGIAEAPQRAVGGDRAGHGDTDGDHPHRRDKAPERRSVQGLAGRQQGGPGEQQSHAAGKSPGKAPARYEAPGEAAGRRHGQRRRAEGQAEAERRQSGPVDQDAGSGGEEHEEGAQGCAEAQRVGAEGPIAQDPAEGPWRPRRRFGARLRPGRQGMEARGCGEAAERAEDGAPAAGLQDQRAGDRAERRHEGEHGAEQAVDRRALRRPGIDVAHRGEGGDQSRRGARRLQHAQRDEGRGRGDEGEQERAAGKQGRAAEQHRPPADPVGERPEQELPDAEDHHVEAERQLDDRRRGAERSRHRRKGRQVDVHGQGGQQVEGRHQQQRRRQREGPGRMFRRHGSASARGISSGDLSVRCMACGSDRCRSNDVGVAAA